VFRCVIEDNSHTAIRLYNSANLTVNSSRISASNYGLRLEGTYVRSLSVIVENTEIRGGRYGVWCSGYRLDLYVRNSDLRMTSISCHGVRSCAVQHCTLSSSHSYQQAITAVNVRTLIIDSNIITNRTSGQAVDVSGCNSVQVRFLFVLILSIDIVSSAY